MTAPAIPGNLDALGIRRRLGRERVSPPSAHGPDGWRYLVIDPAVSSVIVSCATWDGVDWVHASIAHQGRMPTYEELAWLHQAVWPDGFAYQVFTPPANHVNIHEHALHLFGRLDGLRPIGMPEFGEHGTI